ncbi:MAG: T9SS type A sorting domain-containing protein [Crocinitomix sp.]|nr:T9SS type A sorting domain-containing protein [Crocinitomix sp.]
MKKRKNESTYPMIRRPKFMQFKSMIFMFLLTLCGTSALAQPNCPGMGWENEPIQDPDGCCILFDMLPSTLDFTWAYWFVVADGETYNSATYPDGNFEVCYDDPGMENVVVTYVDGLGVTLCENDWTVFVEKGCETTCEDCINFEGIDILASVGCEYTFEADFEFTDACGDITLNFIYWDFGFNGPDGTEYGETAVFDAAFLCAGTYRVIAYISFTTESGEVCIDSTSILVEVADCDDLCSSCYLTECVDASPFVVGWTGGDDCKPTFWFHYSVNEECKDIDPASISFDWDFGYPSGTDTSPTGTITHEFPCNDIYLVTLTFNYRFMGEIEDRSCTMTIEWETTTCDKGCRDKMREKTVSDFTNSPLAATTVPNPANDIVNIMVLDPTNSSDISQLVLVVFDINGKEVFRDNMSLGSQKMIDVSSFESGLYIYEIRDGQTVILKEKLLIK